MAHYLVATASVHTTAAACDALEDDLEEGDRVTVLTVDEPGLTDRDGKDALNVTTARLGPLATVETLRREGDPGAEILALARKRNVDRIVVGARRGDPDAPEEGAGETCDHVLSSATVPVLVVPVPEL